MTNLERIRAALNTTEAAMHGLSRADARNENNQVIFTYPAPVVSGACVGTITVYDDGRIYDDTSDQEFASFDQWNADLNSMMEDA